MSLMTILRWSLAICSVSNSSASDIGIPAFTTAANNSKNNSLSAKGIGELIIGVLLAGLVVILISNWIFDTTEKARRLLHKIPSWFVIFLVWIYSLLTWIYK